LPEQHIDNVLATPETVLGHEKFERIEAVFAGAGDTLSAALAALLATGMDLPEASSEALHYLDRCLDEGFRPGMGQVIPDRLFWALPEDEESPDEEGSEVHPGADYFEVPFNETKH
jgi:hydroxymethylpyrimidine/phosphomethylpyrimidine kinase